MDVKTGMTFEPGGDFGVLVGGIVVANDVKLQVGGDLLIDLTQEGQPLLMAVARGGVGEHLAGKIVQGGKEGHRSMPVVVMGLGANVSLAQRQSGLGAFESLTLAFFITAEHQGPIRRIEVEAHHVPKLFLKLKVCGELEITHPVGLQLMGRPESLHARFAQASFASHHAHAPGPAVRSPRARQTQGPSHSLGRKPRFTSPPRRVLEPLQALGGPSLPPTTDGQKTHSLFLCNLFVGESLSQAQDDASSENIPLAAGLGVHDALEFSLLTGSHFNRYRCWHNRHPTKKPTQIQSYLWDTTLAAGEIGSEFQLAGTTGSYLVLMREGATSKAVKALEELAGASIASTADFESGAVKAEEVEKAPGLVFDKLSVAVVDLPPEQIRGLQVTADEDSGILAIVPERIMYAITNSWPDVGGASVPPPIAEASPIASSSLEYIRGYRDAVNQLADVLLGTGPEALAAGLPKVSEETELTWGLQVTNAAASPFSGRGTRVAVLDTGLDLDHPDFVGRRITSQSFVPNQPVQDGHGHGTHCVGTACGTRQPGQLPRYGVAFQADIFVGKVLSNQGSGPDRGILGGINWAITNGCQIVSMSLGSAVFPGQGFDPIYEQVAQRALAAGTLIIAAAGNESGRPTHIAPIGRPANCPSIMAVGALDVQMRVAPFSNGGLNPQGGQVDIAGPGVAVRSSWPRPTLYRTISGTSMATPHVAGLAALFAEANPSQRGRGLASLLLQNARRLLLPARDVGSGIAQAPMR